MTPRLPSRRQRQVLLALREMMSPVFEKSVSARAWHMGFGDRYWHAELRACVEEGWAEREGAPGTYAYTITPEGLAVLEAGR